MDKEIVSLIFDFFQAAAVVAAAIVAACGLRTWREQLIGNRRFSVAEEALSAFHEAISAINYSRAPLQGVGEGKTREPQTGELESIANLRNHYYVAIERLENKRAIFSESQKAKSKCRVIFGSDVAETFNVIDEIYWDIMRSAVYLINTAGGGPIAGPPQRDLREECEKVIWDLSTNEQADSVRQKLTSAARDLDGKLSAYLGR